MVPQSDLTVVAAILPGHENAVRQLLSSMNLQPGVVNIRNSVLPFADFDRIHFSRLVVLDDPTVGDITAYGLPAGQFPLQLAFLADFDGDYDSFLSDLVARAGSGLRTLFSHCEGLTDTTNLESWLRAHEHTPSTRYVNFVGRTVLQSREEAALRTSLVNYLAQHRGDLINASPLDARTRLKNFVDGELSAGRLKLSPPPATPLGWKIRNLINLLGVPFLLLLLFPFLLLASPILIYQLRRREKTDPVIAPRPEPAHADLLAKLEDHDVTNQFTAMGSLKPGLFRRWLLIFILWIIDYTARHIYNHGRLARVSTIQFARWVFIDNKRRLIFASNYDGSLEAYMDDFINKVAFGLNVVFGNGVAYPRVDWLIFGGAKDEQTFKHVLRRHQVPTEVWYNAHQGWSAVELLRNSMIRDGLEKSAVSIEDARTWLALL